MNNCVSAVAEDGIFPIFAMSFPSSLLNAQSYHTNLEPTSWISPGVTVAMINTTVLVVKVHESVEAWS